MKAVSFAMSLISLVPAGCIATNEASDEANLHLSPLSPLPAVKDIAAVNHSRYPDSVGYLFETPLATIFWMQNEPRVDRLTDLEHQLRRDMASGIKGEFLRSSIQSMEPVGSVQPSLQVSARRTAQSVRQMAQYAAVTADYELSLSTALHTYNSEPGRTRTLTAKVTQVSALLRSFVAPNPVHLVPRPAPPLGAQTIRPGRYFADAVREHARRNLERRIEALQRAVGARNEATYEAAFADVFLAQRDADLAAIAMEGLAVHHRNGVLRGHALDAVIDRYVVTQPTANRPMRMEQLNLLNRINLMSDAAGVSKTALVATLLLLDEDHRKGEQDALLSPSVLWQRVQDTPWLVSQLVRLKSNGTTEAQVHQLLATIVAGA